MLNPKSTHFSFLYIFFNLVTLKKVRHTEPNKALMRNWLSTNVSTIRSKQNLSSLVITTGLTHFQVYDFLNDETKRIKKRNQHSM